MLSEDLIGIGVNTLWCLIGSYPAVLELGNGLLACRGVIHNKEADLLSSGADGRHYAELVVAHGSHRTEVNKEEVQANTLVW